MQSTVHSEPVTTVAHPQVEFVLDGVSKRLDCCDVADVAFETADAVRESESWQHKVNYCGYYWAATVRRHVWFESLYERAALMRIDRNRDVVGIAAQPMWIHWATQPGSRHAPDFFVRSADGGATLVDVRPAEQTDPKTAEVFDRTGTFCERLGWNYAVIDDVSESEQRALRFLSGYRFQRWRSAAAGDRLGDRTGQVGTLSEWVRRLHGCPPDPLGAVFSALWWGELVFDVSERLTMSTVAKAA